MAVRLLKNRHKYKEHYSRIPRESKDSTDKILFRILNNLKIDSKRNKSLSKELIKINIATINQEYP